MKVTLQFRKGDGRGRNLAPILEVERNSHETTQLCILYAHYVYKARDFVLEKDEKIFDTVSKSAHKCGTEMFIRVLYEPEYRH